MRQRKSLTDVVEGFHALRCNKETNRNTTNARMLKTCSWNETTQIIYVIEGFPALRCNKETTSQHDKRTIVRASSWSDQRKSCTQSRVSPPYAATSKRRRNTTNARSWQHVVKTSQCKSFTSSRVQKLDAATTKRFRNTTNGAANRLFFFTIEHGDDKHRYNPFMFVFLLQPMFTHRVRPNIWPAEMLFKRQHCCLGGWGMEPNNIVYHQRKCFLLQHFLLGTDTPTSGEVVRKHLHLTRFVRAFIFLIRCWKQLSWKLWILELYEIRDTFHMQFLDLKRFDQKQILLQKAGALIFWALCWDYADFFFRPESVYNVPISNRIKSIPNADLFWLQETWCRISLRKMETQSVALSACCFFGM